MLSGLLQQFGGLAGMGLGITEPKEALTPALYPEIVRSTPFLINIMKLQVKAKNSDSLVSVYTYLSEIQSRSILSFIRNYTIGLPGTIKKWLSNDSHQNYWTGTETPIRMSPEQESIKKELSKSINANFNSKTEVLSISVQMRDAEVVAQLTDTIAGMLADYIIGYRTQKSQADFKFINDRFSDAKQKFQTAQQNLAQYRDQNKNVISAVSESREEQLNAEYNVAFNVYNTLAQQLEQARIKVQEETPVFKIIEPARVPLNASPIRYLMVFFCILLCFLVALGIIFLEFPAFAKTKSEGKDGDYS
jgi:uncharacterized protein involved in exopolysaccharide biosynthesis